MKIVLISDTHDRHEMVKVPPCDILIHAGDLTMDGRMSRSLRAMHWLNNQDARHVVFIAGNHDLAFEHKYEIIKEHTGDLRIHYLQDSGIELEGLKIWGSPYTPRFHDWAFMYDRAGYPRWGMIPNDTDILITHGPPLGHFDQSIPEYFDSDHLGCFDLRERVLSVKPKIHVFGHIHGGYGHRAADNGVHYYNASVVDEMYSVCNEPHNIEL